MAIPLPQKPNPIMNNPYAPPPSQKHINVPSFTSPSIKAPYFPTRHRYYEEFDEGEEEEEWHAHGGSHLGYGYTQGGMEEEDDDVEWEEDDDDEGEVGSDGQEIVESKKDKRRREYTERYQKLNVDFMDQKEKIYKEKLIGFQKELSDIQDVSRDSAFSDSTGTHPEFLEKLSDLELARDRLIETAELLHDYRLRCADEVYEEEVQTTETDYSQETEGLRERMLLAIEERRKKLKEDKDAVDLTNVDVAIESQSLGKRNLRNRGLKEVTEAKSNKRRREEGPRMVFLLKDEDALQDLNIMRKGMPNIKKSTAKSKK